MVDGGMAPRSTTTPNPDPTLATTQALLREISNARELIEAKVGGLVESLDGRITANSDLIERVRSSSTGHFETSIRGVKEIIETRLAGMDKAIGLLQEIQNKIPVQVDQKADELKDLLETKIILAEDKIKSSQSIADVKFKSIEESFIERDKRVDQLSAERDKRADQLKIADQKAIDVGLISQKEASAKSEVNMGELIRGLQSQIGESFKSTNEKINLLASRLDRGEGVSRGTGEAVTAHSIAAALQLQGQAVQHGGNQNTIALLAALAMGAIAIVLHFMPVSSVPPLVATVPASPPVLQRQSAPAPSLMLPKFSLRVAGFD